MLRRMKLTPRQLERRANRLADRAGALYRWASRRRLSGAPLISEREAAAAELLADEMRARADHLFRVAWGY